MSSSLHYVAAASSPVVASLSPSDSSVSIDASLRPLATSSSTQLISGTLVIQSAAPGDRTDLADMGSSVPGAGLGAHRVIPEAYKGSDSRDTDSSGDASASSDPRARRAAKVQTREELRQAFSVFDTDGDGRITSAEFAVVYKMLGYQVSDTELNELIAELDDRGTGDVEFDQFVALMSRRSSATIGGDGVDPIDDALSVFDTSDPRLTKMSVRELKHVCALLKENLTDEEMETLIKEMQPDPEGMINYAKLVQQMMPGS